ncbi:MAG: hypothetical protein WCI31_01285 [Prolixibacteraceae bacterium]
MALIVHGQTSPHGKSFQIDCAQCHTSTNWKVNPTAIQFNHDITNFKLVGQHLIVNCKDCHLVLTFKDGRSNCLDCHADAHNQSLGKDCGKCHTPKSWIISDVTAMHQKTRFPLLGAHRTVTCSECHKSASKYQYEPLGIECVNCHNTDFQKTTTPNHVTNKYSTFCLECHNENSNSWRTTLTSHESFPLTGGHKVGCGLCHTTGHYAKIPTDCNNCHNKQYIASQIPKHQSAGIPVKCETCHNTSTWKPSSFNHLATGFELKGSHKNVVQCSDCHKGNLTSAKQTCISCHQVQYDKAPNHKTVNYPLDCTQCHTQINWVDNTFNHSATNYPLTGAHQKVKCGDCHLTTLKGTPTVCGSCHLATYNNSQVPAHASAGIPKECATCHTTAAWKPSGFNHTTTGYELKGAHKLLVQCSLCHKGNVTSAPQTCVGCHQAKYEVAPNHKTLGYPTDCIMCHTQNNWLENSFNHATTAFPLTGSHASVQCSKCHVVSFKGTSAICSSCHLPAYISSKLPDHVAAAIPKECATCHTTVSWKPSSFNHATTGYELKGAHTSIVQCSQCHKGIVTSAPQTCLACHQTKYDAAPNHKVNGFPTDCAMCHTQNNWLENSFNHSTTAFPLTGAHTNVICSKCHTVGFKGTSAVCSNCHMPVYTSSQIPTHVAAGIPKECASCHTTASWKPSVFNHTTTGYELKGAHKSVVQCSQCHIGNVTTAPQVCVGCHQVQYNVAPGHTKYGFSTDCAKCHTQDNWLSAIFDHAVTNFPLTGAHSKVICASCHANGYTGTSTVCSSCHLPAFNSSQNPGHVAAGIPKECATCHTIVSWKPSSFNHTTTGYELKGAHKLIVQCSQCHKGNVTSAPQVCIGCHQAQYDVAPSHKSSGFSTDCAKCHSQDNWLSANFDHSTTNFPLTGAHTKVLCATCHVKGYAGTSTACSSCHLPVYTSSQLPGHVAAGIPKECATCHTTAVWKPSTFNHTTTGYELKGAHKLIVQCSDCHKGNVTTAALTCVGCHQAKYDAALNHKAQGYPTDCSMCHTQSNWLENSFNHATTAFPLTGAHTTVLCSKCHIVGFKGTSTVCSSCHLPVYTSSQLPGHVAAGIPKECATCHTTAVWKPSTFNHTTTGYELKGAHKLIVQCSDCHKGNVTTAALTCVGCHQAKYDAALNHKAQGYPTDCSMCHTQSNWLENSFNHATTAFPLTGAHTTVLCSKCHIVGFKGTSTVCSSCHLPVYTSSQLPGHVAAGIPKECASCHTTAVWKPSTFNHTTTGYELKGAHKLIVQCSQCHKGNVTSAALTCIGCHQTNYDTALNHKAQGYPTDCAMCHTQNNWLENSFNHATTAFPLTGAHTTVLCSKCHTTSFKGTSTLCFTCHAVKYNASTNPNHLGAKFPTNCEICHSTKAWTPSTYNHDAQYFPINSGRHKGAWTLCTECHTVPTNYATFSCIVCHTHSNKTTVDGNHKGVKNYAYTGTSCYTCHPRGTTN